MPEIQSLQIIPNLFYRTTFLRSLSSDWMGAYHGSQTLKLLISQQHLRLAPHSEHSLPHRSPATWVLLLCLRMQVWPHQYTITFADSLCGLQTHDWVYFCSLIDFLLISALCPFQKSWLGNGSICTSPVVQRGTYIGTEPPLNTRARQEIKRSGASVLSPPCPRVCFFASRMLRLGSLAGFSNYLASPKGQNGNSPHNIIQTAYLFKQGGFLGSVWKENKMP